MNPKELYDSLSATPITMPYSHWLFLHENMPSGTILEIGRYRACSTVAMAAREDRHVISIDPHFVGEEGVKFGPEDFVGSAKNLIAAEAFCPGIRHRTLLICDTMRDFLMRLNLKLNHVDACFIDGLHDYDSVRQDFVLCHEFTKPGGTIMFHDCNQSHPGVFQLCKEINADMSPFECFASWTKPKNDAVN